MVDNNTNINVSLTSPVIETTIKPNATIISSVITGGRGKSAYEVWIDEGHTGSPEDFLNWLKQDSFVYTELQPLTTWTIVHNLGKYPSVTIIDSADRMVIGEVHYIDANTVEVSFAAGFSGQAFLN